MKIKRSAELALPCNKRSREIGQRPLRLQQFIPYLTILAGLVLAYASILPLAYIGGGVVGDGGLAKLPTIGPAYKIASVFNSSSVSEKARTAKLSPAKDLPSRPALDLPVLMATLAIYAVSITALCVAAGLAARQITAPLANLKEMVDRLWREEGEVDRNQTGGVDAAEDLSAMYQSVNSRLDQRLQILTSFAHDVRIPIERLRNRAAIVASVHERKFLIDIGEIEQLIDEGIAYASQGHLLDENFVLLELEHFLFEIVEGYAETGRNVSLTASVAGRVLVKKAAIKRVIGNFIDNGLKFAGAVEVRSSCLPSGEVSIAVLDRGPGVDDDELEKIVRPFVRSKKNLPSTPGIGLGLTIAHQLAHTANARIKLGNRPGGGLIAAVVVKPAGFAEVLEVALPTSETGDWNVLAKDPPTSTFV